MMKKLGPGGKGRCAQKLKCHSELESSVTMRTPLRQSLGDTELNPTIKARDKTIGEV